MSKGAAYPETRAAHQQEREGALRQTCELDRDRSSRISAPCSRRCDRADSARSTRRARSNSKGRSLESHAPPTTSVYPRRAIRTGAHRRPSPSSPARIGPLDARAGDVLRCDRRRVRTVGPRGSRVLRDRSDRRFSTLWLFYHVERAALQCKREHRNGKQLWRAPGTSSSAPRSSGARRCQSYEQNSLGAISADTYRDGAMVNTMYEMRHALLCQFAIFPVEGAEGLRRGLEHASTDGSAWPTELRPSRRDS